MMDTIRLWAWRFALFVSVILALISFYAGESFLRVVFSAIIGFTLIYAISMVSIMIFEKTSVHNEEIGVLLDIAVGQEDSQGLVGVNHSEREDLETNPGQAVYTKDGTVNLSARAGQLNQEFAEGLPSAEKQAEIVRRMGWGE